MITYLLRNHPRVAVLLLFLVAFVFGETVAHAAATTDVIEMFKYTYMSDRLAYLAAQEIVLWKILSKRKMELGGRGQGLLAVQTKNTGVFKGHTEGGALTTTRAQPDTTEATFSLQEFHGIYDLSWKMMQDARKSAWAMERAVTFMDQSFRRRVFRLLNADLLGFGRGELGILPAADDQTQVTVRALPLVDLGMVVDLMDASDDNTTLGVAAAAVTAIDVANRAITTGSAAAGTAAGDYFTVAGSVSSSASLHLLGLLAWVDDANPATCVGNIGGINRSTAGNDFWQSSVLSNSGTGRPLTEDLLLQGLDLCRERGGVVVSDFISNLAIIRRYHEVLKADVFFALGSVKELGKGVGIGRDQEAMKSGEGSEGETIYQFSGIPWRAEMFFDANTLVGLNREHFWIAHGENEVPRPISEIFDGQIPYFNLPTTPAAKFEVISYWQGELVGDMPTASFKAEDIAES